MRLDKYLSEMGLDTRSELKKAIRYGKAVVDGRVIRDPSFSIDPKKQPVVFYRKQEVHYRSVVYYMMNKPAGVLSAARDKKQKTVLDLLPEKRRKDLFPAGRLDKDTEGLLLITNDGPLSHRLLSPRSNITKVYYARVRGVISEEDCRRFAEGLRFDETLTALPAKLERLSATGQESEVLVRIQEGKFHQIKKMIAALGAGKEVIYLKRLSIGSLRLDEGLKPGESRELTEEEISLLRECTEHAP